MKDKLTSLFLQTALSHTFIALLSNNTCIDIKRTHLDFKSDNTYVFDTGELLKRNNKKPGDIGTLYVLEGPGYFTGIRAGLVIAKAFCDTIHLPIGLLSSFAYLRACISSREDCAILIASSRKEGYIAYFQGTQSVKEEIIQLEQVETIKERWKIYSETPFLVESYGVEEIELKANLPGPIKIVRETFHITPNYRRSITDLFASKP